MSVPRHLRPLLVLAVLGAVLAVAGSVAGVDTGLLLLSPALVLAVPLVLGRYPGSGRLERLAARGRPARPRRAMSLTPPRRRPRAAAAHGGRLLAFALAERAPPSAA
jgi:hypothetical protein